MHDAGDGFFTGGPFEDVEDVLMGVPTMDGYGQARSTCEIEVSFEEFALSVSVAEVAVVVEAGFADDDDVLLSGELFELVPHGLRDVVGFVRVYTDAGEDVVALTGELECALRAVYVGSDVDEGGQSGEACASEYFVAVGVEVRRVEMSVRVDKAHGQTVSLTVEGRLA